MKTIYKKISFLSIGLALSITNAWGHNITGEDQRSHLFFNNYNAYTFSCIDYAQPGNANYFMSNTFVQKGVITQKNGTAERLNKASDLSTNGNLWTFENNFFGFNAYSINAAKGGHLGCNVYKYEYKNGVILLASRIRYNLYTYNDKGNPIEHIYYDPTSSRSDKETFTYNDNGKLAVQVTYFKNGSVCEKTTYKYDAKGNLNEIIWYESGYRLMNRVTYRYDKQNNIVEGIQYIGRDTLIGSDTYQYNENGKISGHKSFNSEGFVRDMVTYEYDAKDFLIEKKMHSGEPSVCRTFVYKNNDLGNLTLMVELQVNQSSIKKAVYIYDINGKMVKHITFDNNYLVTDTFDANGNKIETMTSYKGVSSGKSTYSYDVNGNMIDEVLYNQLNEAYGRMQYVYF